MAVPSIHHVQIAIPAGGEDAARRFYANLLGLTEIEKPENLRARGGLWLETGNLQLHLGVDPAFAPATKAHVAFQVSDIAAVRQRCDAAGHATREDEPLPGYQRFYVDDPFGNRVEILQPDAVDAPSTLLDRLHGGAASGDVDLRRDHGLMRDIDLE